MYVADIRISNCLDAVFARSALAHAVVRSVDASAARTAPGVVGAWTATDLRDLPAVPASEGEFDRPWHSLARDRVRYVGEPIAIVAASDRYRAEDAAERVEVELDPLPVLLDPANAASDRVELFPGHSNVVSERIFGNPIPADIWEDAEVIVEGEHRAQLLTATSMETRGILAMPESGGVTVWCSHQAPHRLRETLADALVLDEARVRVIVPDVGGAFGAKSQIYPEYLAVTYVALLLGRPIRWIEDREEALVASARGRGQSQRLRIAAAADGRILALEAELEAGIGGYPHVGDMIPINTAHMMSGAYSIPHVSVRVRSIVTNTAPTTAYRGAGRPEAAYAVERTVDALARKLGLDPAELRRRNFVRTFPYETPTGRVYDSGDYGRALARALELAEYDRWRAEQARRRTDGGGHPLGIGICCYVERSGGEEGSPEFGSVEALSDGSIVARVGTCSTGQAHETVFAQVVASVLDVELDCVRVVEGDTAEVKRGVGSFASRSLQVGGAALHNAALKVVAEALHRAAARFEASPDAVRFAEGAVHLEKESLTLAELVAETGPLVCEDVFHSPQAFPFGSYVAVVEIDPELGCVTVLRLVAVDDYGVVVNPLVVEGQTRGSIAQGLGQALYEEVIYDDDGVPLARSLLDYLLPTLSEIPDITLDETETPNPNTPLGAKGAGEAGCIGVPPAIANAVADALDLDDSSLLQMPLTPETVWRALPDLRVGR